ncbi:Sigma-E factor negative regulatory protein [Mannheimia sp. USDA-ARS-USMARC-1261]|uniref:sigma-E factor negative regulatory protein n=1 Tax=Mannheimia TaxID=75984 RepID=UPI0003E3268A|nr:RseA family anti-sigma factor [Mannheimia sp. USDA-ARS-USMARC-1261]AHG73657.1 Sigma-E factor negative regulatory protein [Mannheimia sp. USDA-ARS-USMARC-1261]
MQQRITQHEYLSAYMDGQDVDKEFVETLTNSPELQQKWASYHTIRNVMQGDEIILGADFSAKMEALLENEEIESQANVEKPKGLLLKLKRWGTPLLQAGVAASVCLVAVFGVNSFNANNEVAQTQPVLQTLPFSNSVEAVSYNAPAKDQPTAEQLELQQRKINALLENHELQRRTNTVQGVTLSEEEKQKAKTSSNQVEQQNR